MPLLGGIFSRKNKSSSPRLKGDDRSDSLHSNVTSDWDPSLSPTSTSSYITPNKAIPSYPNASNLLHPDSARQNYSYMQSPSVTSMPTSSTSASSSRLRLPFGRKKSAVAELNPSTPDPPRKSFQTFQTVPRPSENRTSTDTESPDPRRLRPPPSRSAIFAAYGDSNNLSTRSLPNEGSLSPNSPHSTSFLQTPPPLPNKKSLFGWGKNNPSPSPEPSPSYHDSRSMINGYQEHAESPNGQESFNLRSFRHIRGPSPNGSNVSLTPPVPVPRPRGESINSDSAQRISVAAFREAQARRSQAGSPSPSFRDSSPAPGFTNHPRSDGGNSPRPPRSANNVPSQQQRRRSSMAINTTTDSDDSASSSEEELEDVAHTRNSMASTLNKSGRTKAKSEAGHGRHAPTMSFKSSDFPPTSPVPSSHVGHSSSNNASQQRPNVTDDEKKTTELPPRSQSSLSVYTTNLRKRASVSTSALTPSLAAKRASIVAATNARMGNASGSESRPSLAATKASLQTPQLTSQPSKTSLARSPVTPKPADSDSDSDDDAPLATLVGPRRPGSAMSSYSNLASRSTGNVTTRSATNMPPKPLIDINELTGPKRSHTSPLEKSTAGFTSGPTLLSRTERKPAVSLHQPTSPLVESPVSMSPPPWHSNILHTQEPLTSTVPPVKFASPMGSPVKEKDQFISRAELDRAMQSKRTSSADMDDAASGRRDSSPEMRRDHITERLSRAVKSTLQATSPSQESAAPASTFASTVSPPQQLTSTSRATSSSSGNASEASRLKGAETSPAPRARPGRSEMPFPKVESLSGDHSSQDEELAQLLGTAVQFMSGNSEPPRNRSSSSSSSSSESSDDSEDGEKEKKTVAEASKDRIAPIPIKQRSPPPSFSVTSRPHVAKHENTTSSASIGQAITNSPSSGFTQRPRSTTLQASSSSTSFGARNGGSGNESNSPPMPSPRTGVAVNGNAGAAPSSPKGDRSSILRPGIGARQRSSTMITGVPLSAQMNKQANPNPIPEKPFAMRRNSPSSSTGDSSNGRAPLTPKDGSDIGGKQKVEAVERPKKHIKRRSVSFEDDMDELRPPVRAYLKTPSSSRASSDAGEASTTDDDLEERKRRDRRRGEAKASIELGKVINGRGPVLDDDEDMPINQGMNMRMSALNPMMAMGNPMAMQMGQMGFGGSPNAGGWGAGMGQPMLSPAQFMMPPPADPNFFAAHQQAMAIAKQAYQMAVAQQAMAAAADEWERGSAVGGFGGGSTYGGGGSVYGGGGGGSVYGGSQVPSMMGSSFGMMGGMNMMQGGWGSAASMYGGGGGSVYGGSQLGVPNMNSSRSEYGGAGRGGGGNWSSSKSSYGESFGPDQSSRRTPGQTGRRGAGPNGRESGYFPPMPPIPASQSTSGRNSPDLRSSRGKPNSPHRKLAPPPSSWKAS